VTAPEPALVDRVRARLASRPGGGPASPADVAAALRAEGHVLGGRSLLEVIAALGSELGGLGVLEPLLDDPEVTDILVNAPEDVWVERAGVLQGAGVRFRDEAAVRALAQRLVGCVGRRLDDASPYADVRLPGGLRLHAVLAPVSTRGTCLSLRVPARRRLGLDDLIRLGALDAAAAEVLRRLVVNRVSTLVTGGAGAGKTTVLAAMLSLVPADERVVVVEDSSELRPDHPHQVLLEARPPNVEGAGRIRVADLVRQAVRMRPDRLVVGEVRGEEVVDLLAALNTGHRGGFGTVHANSAADLPARIEALALAAGMGRAAVHAQLAAGVGAVVHLGRDRSGGRRVVEIAVPERDRDGLVHLVTALSFDPGGPRNGPAVAQLDRLLSLVQ
jgi:pilus assembly protein CpaF